MPLITVNLECPVVDSFRVRQLFGMFDLPPTGKSALALAVQVPDLGEDWSIGLITGPSGSGKSTIARAAFPADCIPQRRVWPSDRAIIDAIDPDAAYKVQDVVAALCAVGFSSPPDWLKPHRVLSNGQQFRVDLADAMLNSGRESCVVMDEFTSVVDRTVAKVASFAAAKSVRSGRFCNKFVAVSCHSDITQWLEPDWVLDMSTGELARGRLRRPPVELEIYPAVHAAWHTFKRHHYLIADASKSARYFLATVDGKLAALTSVMTDMAGGFCFREHRTVCLPDFQGVGIGNALGEFIAGCYGCTGRKFRSTTGHPAMIAHRIRSPLWQVVRSPGHVNRGGNKIRSGNNTSARRMTAGFIYVGPPNPVAARRFGIPIAISTSKS